MNRNDEYRSRIQQALRDKRWTLRDLALRSGYPEDLLRELMAGHMEPHTGQNMNSEICEALGLDADEMWDIALSATRARAS